MTRFLAVAGLALRELWISFRLLLLVALFLLTALPASLLRGPSDDPLAAVTAPLQPFAIALAAAISVAAGVAAGTLATERRRGTAGWLAGRAVPRSSIVVGWFAAFAVVLLLGIIPAAGLAWLTLGPASETIDPVAFAVTVASAAAVGLAAVAAGLLFGAWLGVRPGMVLSGVLAAAVLVPAAAPGIAALAAAPAPGAPFALLADLADASRPIGDSVLAGGLALAGGAGLLILASALMSRADL